MMARTAIRVAWAAPALPAAAGGGVGRGALRTFEASRSTSASRSSQCKLVGRGGCGRFLAEFPAEIPCSADFPSEIPCSGRNSRRKFLVGEINLQKFLLEGIPWRKTLAGNRSALGSGARLITALGARSSTGAQLARHALNDQLGSEKAQGRGHACRRHHTCRDLDNSRHPENPKP